MTGAAAAEPARPRGAGLAAVALVLLTVWAYRGMLAHHFHSDDFALVLQNRDLGAGGLLRWLVLGDYGGRSWAYWRPGSSLLFWSVHGAAGPWPAPHMLTALLLHAACVVAVYRIALRVAGAVLPAAAAAAVFALHPSHAEAVVWVSAAFNVLPACLLLTTAGWLLWRRHAEGRKRDAWCAFALIGASFAFKEAAYGFPLVVAASWWFGAQGRRWQRAHLQTLLLGLGLGAAIGLHYVFRSHVIAPPGSLADHATVVIACLAAQLRALAPLPGGDGEVVAIAAVIFAVVFARGSPLSRYLLVWSVGATLPYVVMTSGSRFSYFLHAPLALLLAQAGSAFGAARSVVRAVLAAAAIVATLLLSPLRLQDEIDRFGRESEEAQRVLDALEQQQLLDADRLAVDRVPEGLRNGLESAIELRLGRRIEIRSLDAVPRPPFLIVIDDGARTARAGAFLYFDAEAKRYARRSFAEAFGDLIPVPLFTLAGRYRVVADEAESLQLLRSGAVDPVSEPILHAPPPGPVSEPVAARVVAVHTDVRNMGLVVECERAVLLVVAFPIAAEFTKPPGAIHVDGKPVPVVRANLLFCAIVVPAGRHDVRLVPSLGG
ncbi:MAG TPA: hypothetical protein VFD82_23055 [Planctomycetota bacterium]|nr:hypothetical protein [Planctomycetota bacterium]